LTVASATGAVIATDGGVVSGVGGGSSCGGADVLPNVTGTVATAVLPAVSVARAVIACDPSAYADVSTILLHDTVPAASAYSPRSRLTSTVATAALSEAMPMTGTEPERLAAAAAAGAPTTTDGGVVSGAGCFRTFALAGCASAISAQVAASANASDVS
jgi:hypothetical protein